MHFAYLCTLCEPTANVPRMSSCSKSGRQSAIAYRSLSVTLLKETISIKTYIQMHTVSLYNINHFASVDVYIRKTFPTVKRRTCIHVLRHYSRNSYSNFGRHFLGVQRVTLGRPRTKGTANNDRAYSFCGFLPNPFIQHLFLCPTSQERE